jgi:hypothetical protein
MHLRKNLVLPLAALAVLALVAGMIGCVKNPAVFNLLNGVYPTVLVEPGHAFVWESPTPFIVQFLGANPCTYESSASGKGPNYSWTCSGLQTGTFMYIVTPVPPSSGTPAPPPPPPTGPPNYLSVGHCDPCKSKTPNPQSVGHCDMCRILRVPGTTSTPAGYPIGIYCGDDGAAAYPPNYPASSGEPVNWVGTGTGANNPNWTVTFDDDKACTNGKIFSSTKASSAYSSCTAGTTPGKHTYTIKLDGCKDSVSRAASIVLPPTQ